MVLCDLVVLDMVLIVFCVVLMQYNPCEQVFARAKRYLREERDQGSFLREVLEAFGCVSFVDMIGYYEECIEKPLRDD